MRTSGRFIRGWTNEDKPATWAELRAALKKPWATTVRVETAKGWVVLSLSRPIEQKSPARPFVHIAIPDPSVDAEGFINSHKFIDVPESRKGFHIRIMAGQLSMGHLYHFARLAPYDFSRQSQDFHNQLLKPFLYGHEAGRFLSLIDGRAYAKWLSGLTGGKRDFRVPTWGELYLAFDILGRELSGEELWEWTDGLHTDLSKPEDEGPGYWGEERKNPPIYYYLRDERGEERKTTDDGWISDDKTVRLIEDLK